MPVCRTRYFGELDYRDDAVLEFPRGLPGFDRERRFVPIEQPTTKPLVFLQSVETPEVCFVTLPVLSVDAGYEPEISDEDREVIGLAHGEPARPGGDLLCLAIVSIRETAITANLMAPVLVSLASRRAVQAIAPVSRYSHQHPLG